MQLLLLFDWQQSDVVLLVCIYMWYPLTMRLLRYVDEEKRREGTHTCLQNESKEWKTPLLSDRSGYLIADNLTPTILLNKYLIKLFTQ